jgi:hypothetical protein
MSTMKFARQDSYHTYSVKIGRKAETDQTAQNVMVFMDQAEAIVLAEFFRTSIRNVLGF